MEDSWIVSLSFKNDVEGVTFRFFTFTPLAAVQHPKLPRVSATLLNFVFQRWFLIELKNRTGPISHEINGIDTGEDEAQRVN